MLRLGFLLLLSVYASAQNAATFQWIQQTDSTGFDSVAGFGVDAAGNSYIAGATASSNFAVVNSLQHWSKPIDGGVYSYAYVTKLDPAGNVVYSTLFGGSGYDTPTAMTVDAAGDVYVTGTTTSKDFPVTPGAYATSGGTFVFKLKPDGSLGYSTYFVRNPPGGQSVPVVIGVDPSGAVYLGGTWEPEGGTTAPITAGAYQSTCTIANFFGDPEAPACGFVSKLDPTGSTLVYFTYVGTPAGSGANLVTCIAVDTDASVYVGGMDGIYHLNATGSALLAAIAPANDNQASNFVPTALALASDGSLYAAGHASTFAVTSGAFQTSADVAPLPASEFRTFVPGVIVRWDGQLANVLDATYFGEGRNSATVSSIDFDASGNVYLAGATDDQGIPTRTPLQLGFATSTGFVSELSGDLSKLLFASYFGDTRLFSVAGIGVRSDGSVALGGLAQRPSQYIPAPGDPFVNSLTLGPAPALRVDSVVNTASLLDGPVSAGETVTVQGVGFGTNPQLTIGGVTVPAISSSATSVTATVPSNLSLGAAVVQVGSGGAVSNGVAVEVAPASPAIFSLDGSGFGQGYVLNHDGTLNTPANPAAQGDPIAIFATGVGPISNVQGYAVTQYPVNVYLDGINCNGIEAFVGPVPGLPGNVYMIQVFVPNLAELRVLHPQLPPNFPPLVSLNLKVNGVTSQNGIAFSVSQ